VKVCQGLPHLEEILQDIIDKGGEGIILRDPKAPLQAGRGHGYLKHKVSADHFLNLDWAFLIKLSDTRTEIQRWRGSNCCQSGSSPMGMRTVS